jgi:hypothetical protein
MRWYRADSGTCVDIPGLYESALGWRADEPGTAAGWVEMTQEQLGAPTYGAFDGYVSL